MSQFFKNNSSFPAAAPVVFPEAYPYQALPTDYAIMVDSNTPTTIVLPNQPMLGLRYLVKDETGNSGTNPITIDGNGNTIDDQPIYTLQVNYSFVGVLFNGLQWSVINQ